MGRNFKESSREKEILIGFEGKKTSQATWPGDKMGKWEIPSGGKAKGVLKQRKWSIHGSVVCFAVI